jgi:hypothetical protein
VHGSITTSRDFISLVTVDVIDFEFYLVLDSVFTCVVTKSTFAHTSQRVSSEQYQQFVKLHNNIQVDHHIPTLPATMMKRSRIASLVFCLYGFIAPSNAHVLSDTGRALVIKPGSISGRVQEDPTMTVLVMSTSLESLFRCMT